MYKNYAKQVNTKDKWFFCFSFIPLLQFITCFMMNSRVQSKKYIILGIIPFAFFVYLFIGIFVFPLIVVNTWGLVFLVILGKWITYLILLFFIERPKYYEKLVKARNNYKINKEFSKSRNFSNKHDNDSHSCLKCGAELKADSIFCSSCGMPIKSAHKEINPPSDLSKDKDSAKLNINTATEAQFVSKFKIDAKDAKKIITYREANGAFTNIDEFFESFNAKPHMIINIQEQIIIGKTKKMNESNDDVTIYNNSNDKKRESRFDL